MLSQHARPMGNILVMILVAIILVAGLTYAISHGERAGSNLSTEKTTLAVDQSINFALDLKRAVENMTRAGKSETSISFASADLPGYGTAGTAPANEVFHIVGGGVSFVRVPANINDGGTWEIYGNTAAPGVGDDDKPDLMLVEPNVSDAYCAAYNKRAGYAVDAVTPTDSGTCIHNTSNLYAGTFATGGAINTMDAGTFRTPAPFACVKCGAANHAYYVLLER